MSKEKKWYQRWWVIALIVIAVSVIYPIFNSWWSYQYDGVKIYDDYAQYDNSVVCHYDLDCNDFLTCSEAKKVFNECLNRGFGDIHSIDINHNRIPCESLC
jgi:hypothetical protein